MIRLKPIHLSLPLIVLVVISTTVSAQSASADEDNGVRNIYVTVTTSFHNTSNRPANINVKVPLWSDEPSPYQTVLSESFNLDPVEVMRQETYRVGVFQFTVDPGATANLIERYAISIHRYTRPPAADMSLPQELANMYLSPEPGIESDDPRIIQLARQLTANKPNDRLKAEAIFNYVKDHITYDESSPAANKGAIAALEAGAGVCTEFASLFTALARAAGIPSRIVNGMVLLDAHGQLASNIFAHKARHQWAEYFDSDYGWVPVDPTFAQSLEQSLNQAAYIRQNFGDRSIVGTSRGGTVKTTRSITLKQLIHQ